MQIRGLFSPSSLVLACALSAGCMGPYVAPPYPDEDGDGVSSREDCRDDHAEVYPGAPELCDDVDNDCDGEVDEDAADRRPFFRDVDGDGFGEDSLVLWDCREAVTGYVLEGGDCAPMDASVHPAAEERCDGLDEDCDGRVDEAVVGAPTWYPDLDQDGRGDEVGGAAACEAPEGWVANDDDCDDGEPLAWSGAREVCDDVDNDCDGAVDDADIDVDLSTRREFRVDADRDGYGAVDGAWREACSQPEGYAPSQDDCDDTDPSVNPGATEVWYDGLDADCDGHDDDDADGDGWPLGDDCDDADPNISPSETELWYDGVDADCDAANDYDADGDGFASDAHSGDDCDDADSTVHPYAWEVWDDAVDNDCDGDVDDDDLELAYSLNLTEDGWQTLELFAPVSLCGGSWTLAHVAADGLIQLDGETLDDGESAGEFCAEGPVVAGLWDDYNPALGGDVAVVWRADAFSVYWQEIRETTGARGDNSFAATLLQDGRVYLEYEGVSIADGLAGWSCGEDPSAPEVDLSTLPYVAGSVGLGQGTEAAVYEVFTAGDNDLSGAQLMLCAQSGQDDDDDGWTDLCGDPDDSDPTVTP